MTTTTYPDPLHTTSEPHERWTTRNFAEAMPGVPTALSWSIWGPGMAFAALQDYRWMGVYSRRELAQLEAGELRTASIFYGHVAGNVNCMSLAVARTPGADPVAFERDYFGIEISEQTPRKTRRRLPIVLPHLLLLQRQHPERLRRLAAETDAWWSRSVTTATSPEAARLLLADAADRFKMAMAIHSIQSSLAQAAFGKLAGLAAAAGAPGAEMTLATGSGLLEELDVARDLWRVAHGQLDLPTFLARHGYHGPNEGELSTHSWREDPTPVGAAVESFKARADEEGPDAHVRRLADTRARDLARVLDARPARSRARLARKIEAAARDVALRELGKAAFLKVLDVGRYAARLVGDDLARSGVLDDADDVFDLTLDEVLASPSRRELQDLVAARQAKRKEYLGYELPSSWIGQPTPVPVVSEEPTATVLRGLPASPGVVEGRARLVLDPEEDLEPLDDEEILVASTTDPGWVSLFMAAGGMVIDVGGPMSHSAIVARELGIPCVINTGNGTRHIRTGDLLRVDGTSGAVEITRR